MACRLQIWDVLCAALYSLAQLCAYYPAWHGVEGYRCFQDDGQAAVLVETVLC